jgi:hypothetical protein
VLFVVTVLVFEALPAFAWVNRCVRPRVAGGRIQKSCASWNEVHMHAISPAIADAEGAVHRGGYLLLYRLLACLSDDTADMPPLLPEPEHASTMFGAFDVRAGRIVQACKHVCLFQLWYLIPSCSGRERA